MGLGQTLLTILALMMMGRIILSLNTTTLDTGMMKDLAEYRITGTSYGVSMLEKIESESFDENTEVVDSITVVSSFSPYSKFGPGDDGGGETRLDKTTYDDVDDYDTDTLSATINGVYYSARIVVDYVELDTINVRINTLPRSSTTKTYNKMIRVFVTSAFLIDYSRETPSGKPYPDTLKFERIVSYWSF